MPNKAVAAGGTVALAGAITTLVVGIWWPGATEAETGALTTVISAVLATLATYFTPHNGG